MRIGGLRNDDKTDRLGRASVVPAIMLLVLIGTFGGATAQVLNALDARRIESSAVELELAAYTVAMVELVPRELPRNLATQKRDAIIALQNDLQPALSPLPVDRIIEADTLRDQIIEAAGADGRFPRATANDFLEIAREAVAIASVEAATAEQNAIRLVAVAGLTGILAISMLFVSRRRERRLRNNLRTQATTDELTGLPNRRGLQNGLDLARSEMHRSGCMTGFLYLDLDGFKSVNDTLGHAAGDELLAATADRLDRNRQPNERLVRLGGDEFAVVLAGLPNAEAAEDAALRYLRVLDTPCEIHGRLEFLRSSIGVAVAAEPDGVAELHREADIAMYAAKRTGGQRIERFRPELRAESEASSAMSRALRNAHYDDEFHVVYQPIVTVDATDTLFVEALARWNSSALGHPVSPGDFIPVAEATGEIHSLGFWMLRNVIDQLVAWDNDPAMAGISASCNVSPIQFVQDGFVDDVLAALRSSGIDPHRLIIEVTESAALDASGAATSSIHQLNAAGIRIAIDDFGSGYSNLGELFEVPFDILKLDRGLLLQLDVLNR